MKRRKAKRISISILTYNRSKILKNLLDSLQDLAHEPLQIIVVDNHSTDDTKNIIQELFCDIDYIRTESNVGAGARNFGLKDANGDIVITLDDDIIGVNDDHISLLMDYFIRRPNLAAINFKVLNHVTGEVCNWVHHYKAEVYSNKEFMTYEITEGAVAFRKEALEKTGYYPETFFLSHEGPDLALRLLNKGYEVIYSPDIEVIHCHASSGRKTWFNYYYDTRNQFWLAARNFPVPYAIGYLSRGLLSMFAYSARDGFLFYWIKGVIDGIRGLRDAIKERSIINHKVMLLIRTIEKNRPNIGYFLRSWLFRRSARL
jgi:GT2 family glycosyltransferase